MRIYAVADIHANADRLEKIRAIIADQQPDVLVVAGDADAHFRRGSMLNPLNSMGVPVLVVRGNTDKRIKGTHRANLGNIRSLHLQKVDVRATEFVGVGGTVLLPFLSKLAFREHRLASRVRPLIDHQSVLVVHPPPRGVLDKVAGRWHAGSFVVRDLILAAQPRLALCGHIHEHAGIDQLGNTVVVNCSMGGQYAGAIIDLAAMGQPSARLV